MLAFKSKRTEQVINEELYDKSTEIWSELLSKDQIIPFGIRNRNKRRTATQRVDVMDWYKTYPDELSALRSIRPNGQVGSKGVRLHWALSSRFCHDDCDDDDTDDDDLILILSVCVVSGLYTSALRTVNMNLV